MPQTEAQKRANMKYAKKAYIKVSFDSRREDRLNDLVKLAADKHGISKAEYISGAIQARLELDGITIDQLPSIEN